MIVSDLLNIIKNSLGDDGVYRSDAFLLERLNEGYKLTGLFALFDERRASVSVTGTRNFTPLPKSGSDECIAPLYMADSVSGRRVHPVKIDQFEFYQSGWEGEVDSDGSQYYSLLSPFNFAHSAVVVCPIDSTGSATFNFIGAFVPTTLTSTSTARIPESHIGILSHYTRFAAFVGEPGRAEDMTKEYKAFSDGLELFVVSIKSRFPSGRDHEPFPPEFVYDAITEQQRKVAPPKQEEKENA